jgi:hypothetical protein
MVEGVFEADQPDMNRLRTTCDVSMCLKEPGKLDYEVEGSKGATPHVCPGEK